MLSEHKANEVNGIESVSPIGRALLLWCAVVVFGGVVTGSLLPFSFDVACGGVDEMFGLTRLGWQGAGGSVSDALANFLVYVPVGGVLALGTIRRNSFRGGRGVLGRLGFVLGLGLLLSLGLEWVQTMMSFRVASWKDVCMNGLGTLAGAIAVGCRGMLVPAWGRLIRGMAWRPITTTVKLMTVGLLAYHLLPFDFVTSTESMWASMRETQLWPARTSVDAAAEIAWLGYAAQFALLGFASVLGKRERGQSFWDSVNGALTHVGILALLIEVVQLFVVSHSFDTMDWLVGASGGIMGVALAGVLVVKGEVPSLRQMLGLVVVVQVGYLLASSAAPFDWHWPESGGLRVLTTPFWGHFLRPFGAAMASLLEIAVTYGVLAAVMRRLLVAQPRVLRTVGVVATAFVVASLCELLQLLTSARYPDVTVPLVAVCVAMGVAMFEPPTTQRVKALERIRTGRRS